MEQDDTGTILHHEKRERAGPEQTNALDVHLGTYFMPLWAPGSQ